MRLLIAQSLGIVVNTLPYFDLIFQTEAQQERFTLSLGIPYNLIDINNVCDIIRYT